MTYFPKPQPCGRPGVAAIMGSSAVALLIGASAATAGSKMYDSKLYPMDDPEIIEAPGPIQPQPSAPDRYDWNGYYAGVSLGYAFLGDDEVGFRGDNIQGNRIIGDLQASGPTLGIHAGRNWHRHDDNIVVGVEGSIAYARISDDISSDGNSASVDIDMSAAVRGRVGYAMDRNLIYVSGGLAAGSIDYAAESAEGDTLEDSETRIGYTLGVGVETAINRDWTVRGEYAYTNYRGKDLTGTNNLTTRATPDHHSVSVGLNRRF